MIVEHDLIDLVLRSIVLSTLGVIWVVAVVRVVGLRAFSKMTAFDFVVTVAIGSLLAGASQATTWSEFAQPALAMAGLLMVQAAVARARLGSERLDNIVQNRPALLMRDGEVIEGALLATRVSRSDLVAKLREANVTDFSEVRAVVLETTGDISVLHGPTLDDQLLDGVERRG